MISGTGELRQLISDRFSQEELRTLCYDLDVDYDDLPGESKTAKARELIQYLERRDRIYDLIEKGEELRPDVPWKEI